MRRVLAILLFLSYATAASALSVARVDTPIVVDGLLDDRAWASAEPVTTWFEIEPGDNNVPPVASTARLAMDAHSLYAGFSFDDPQPAAIRAPFTARDGFTPDTDYAGLWIDTQGDGRSAQFFYVNPRGVQYDGVRNDVTDDQNTAPDFYWQSAARITARGWTLEMRIPLSTLRYTPGSARWRILLLRNWPRDQRYRIASARVPRGSGCTLCHAGTVAGLEVPRPVRRVTTTPYSAVRSGHDPAARRADGGADLKFAPDARTAVDLTLNPDFSQIESDTLAISANQRFAISYPEKRPFFLEGLQLFDTPLPVVATRTITAPDWGMRATRTNDAGGYTLLLAGDRGGGSVIIPGTVASVTAPQDFRSLDVIGRAKRSWGDLTLGGVVTAREISGGGSNRVAGPDVVWRRGDIDTVSGEFLASTTTTPRRPDLAAEWDGRSMSSYAANIVWRHNTTHWDWYDQYIELGNGFRADLGYVPQVGSRELYTNTGYTIHPHGFVNSARFYLTTDDQPDLSGRLLYRVDTVGTDIHGAGNSFFRARLASGVIRAGTRTIHRNQFLFAAETNLGKRVTQVGIEGSLGQQIDYTAAVRGHGPNVHYYGTLHPAERVEVAIDGNLASIERSDGTLFTSQTERVQVQYAFSVASTMRFVAQNEHTNRSPERYGFGVAGKEGSLAVSLLYGYRLNYATALYVGAGDARQVDALLGSFLPSSRSVFAKVAYAFRP